MFSDFKKYTVRTIDQAITIDEHDFSSYVEIDFLDEYHHQLSTIRKGILSDLDIAKMWQEGRGFNFDNCYVKNFDFAALLNTNQTILSFSSQNAVFEADTETSFQNATFECDNISFEGSYFLKGKLNFHAAKLAKQSNDFSYTVFHSGEVDFANASFGSELNSFKNSVFKLGTKNFQYSNFQKSELLFTNVHFGNGDLMFINADFQKCKVNFKVAVFGNGKVDFHYSQFQNADVTFERANFQIGDVDFSKTDFGSGKINFNRTSFNDGLVSFEGLDITNSKVSFKKASFKRCTVDFSEANCKGTSILFDNASFIQSNFTFENLKAKNLSFQSCHLNNTFDFRVCELELIDLSNTIVRDILDFTPYDQKVKIGELNLFGMRLVGKIFIDWDKNQVNHLIAIQKSDFNQKAYQYRLLKENFHNTGEYDAEDKAYVQFRRAEEKAILESNKAKGNQYHLFGYISFGFKNLILDKAGLYATSPIRVMQSMMITYVFYSLLIFFSTLLSFGDLTGTRIPGWPTLLFDSFYYSIITFFTIGYGDFCPLGFNRVIAGLEGFSGVFFMSYFTVAFVRRILR